MEKVNLLMGMSPVWWCVSWLWCSEPKGPGTARVQVSEGAQGTSRDQDRMMPGTDTKRASLEGLVSWRKTKEVLFKTDVTARGKAWGKTGKKVEVDGRS